MLKCIYKYVKEIKVDAIDNDIDNLDDSYNIFKAGFKTASRKLKLNDKINILNSKMPNEMFLYEKTNGIKDEFSDFLPKSFLNTNFERVDNHTSMVRPSSLGGKRKKKRKTLRIKSKNKRNMSKRRK